MHQIETYYLELFLTHYRQWNKVLEKKKTKECVKLNTTLNSDFELEYSLYM